MSEEIKPQKLEPHQRFRFTKKMVAQGVRSPIHRKSHGYFLPIDYVRENYRKERLGDKIVIESSDTFIVNMVFEADEGLRLIAIREKDKVTVWFFLKREAKKDKLHHEIVYL